MTLNCTKLATIQVMSYMNSVKYPELIAASMTQFEGYLGGV